MEGFDNPGLHVRWQAKRTHPSHLLKGAKAFPLHRIPPGSPLSVNPEVFGGDPHSGQETGMTGPLESVLSVPHCVRAIADDHSFLRVHLHVGLLESFEHIPVAITEVVRKVRSGSNQDHIIHVLADLHLPARTLQSADQESMQQVYRHSTTWRWPACALHGVTHRSLDEDTPAPTVHVQSKVERVEREATLYSKLFQLS
eukprot:2698020-Amphidinium_carterae.1